MQANRVQNILGDVRGRGGCSRLDAAHSKRSVIWPYGEADTTSVESFLWRWRSQLCSRVAYGQTQLERGLRWFDYSMYFARRFETPLSLTFGDVATHNHFVLDRGGKFSVQTRAADQAAHCEKADHLGLLGLLNSSVPGFWLRQVSSRRRAAGASAAASRQNNGSSVSSSILPKSPKSPFPAVAPWHSRPPFKPLRTSAQRSSPVPSSHAKSRPARRSLRLANAPKPSSSA